MDATFAVVGGMPFTEAFRHFVRQPLPISPIFWAALDLPYVVFHSCLVLFNDAYLPWIYTPTKNATLADGGRETTMKETRAFTGPVVEALGFRLAQVLNKRPDTSAALFWSQNAQSLEFVAVSWMIVSFSVRAWNTVTGAAAVVHVSCHTRCSVWTRSRESRPITRPCGTYKNVLIALHPAKYAPGIPRVFVRSMFPVLCRRSWNKQTRSCPSVPTFLAQALFLAVVVVQIYTAVPPAAREDRAEAAGIGLLRPVAVQRSQSARDRDHLHRRQERQNSAKRRLGHHPMMTLTQIDHASTPECPAVRHRPNSMAGGSLQSAAHPVGSARVWAKLQLARVRKYRLAKDPSCQVREKNLAETAPP